eukprot:7192610-Pyramimonas_sp.AAC.1
MVKEREQAAKERDLRAQGQALAAALQSSFADHLEGLQTAQKSTGHSASTVGTPRDEADSDGGGDVRGRSDGGGRRRQNRGGASEFLAGSECGWLQSIVGREFKVKSSESKEVLIKAVLKSIEKKNIVGS